MNRALSRTRLRASGGRLEFARMLEEIPLRVAVSGIRGKSSLVTMIEREMRARGLSTYAKITGTDPISIREGVHHPIARKEPEGPVMDETIREVMKHRGDGIQALVLENQAITPYTMRVFNHRFCRPHFLLITNVRRDHLGDIARSLHSQARAFGRSALPGCTIICGEQDEQLSTIIEIEARILGCKFIDAAPPGRFLYPPGFECLSVLDAFLSEATGKGLGGDALAAEADALAAHFSWQPSGIPDVRWFHGAEANDVDSTSTIHSFLQRHGAVPTSFVAYFRGDRPDRTAQFVEFLRRGFTEGWAERAYLAGHGSAVVARRLGAWNQRIRLFRDDLAEVPTMLGRIADECRGEAVMTVANAVPPFPRAIHAALSADWTTGVRMSPPQAMPAREAARFAPILHPAALTR